MINSRTEWGQMVDFLRANPWCSKEDYIWGMSVAQIRLASFDFSHIDYSNSKKGDKKNKPQKIRGVADLRNMTDLGVPIINSTNTSL